MAALTTKRRNALPKSQFALPEKDGYPVDTPGRARNALSRASQFASPSEQSRIRAKVKREYPGIKQSTGNNNGKKNNPGGGGGAAAAGAGGAAGGLAAGQSASARGRAGGGRNNNNNRIANELSRRLDARSRSRR